MRGVMSGWNAKEGGDGGSICPGACGVEVGEKDSIFRELVEMGT